jgi:proteasome-associated ATPase
MNGPDDFGSEEAALRQELARLREEVEVLRAGRTGGLASEQIARLRAQVHQLTTQNERLTSTLRDAREQIVALKAEVDRLAQPRTRSASTSARPRRARSR